MKAIYKIINLAIVIFVIACTSIPKQYNSQSSVIAIEIGKPVSVNDDEDLLAWGMFKPRKVVFIRLDDDELISKDIIEWSRDDKYRNSFPIYLFNVKPGRYAAIALYGTEYTETSAQGCTGIAVTVLNGTKSERTGKTVFTKYSLGERFIIFSEELIKSTIVDVEPGTFVYMGGFLIDTALYKKASNEYDEVQKYYYKHFSSIDKELTLSNFWTLFGLLDRKKYSYGLLKEKFTSTDNKIKFLIHQKLGKFKGTQWEANIDRTFPPLFQQRRIEDGQQKGKTDGT